ncbi:transposase [Alkaliphilus crotonatoxidans]
MPLIKEFRNRALKRCYPFVFVDAMYPSVKTETDTGQKALYNVIGVIRRLVRMFWASGYPYSHFSISTY